jgi:hypothetical protein
VGEQSSEESQGSQGAERGGPARSSAENGLAGDEPVSSSSPPAEGLRRRLWKWLTGTPMRKAFSAFGAVLLAVVSGAAGAVASGLFSGSQQATPKATQSARPFVKEQNLTISRKSAHYRIFSAVYSSLGHDEAVNSITLTIHSHGVCTGTQLSYGYGLKDNLVLHAKNQASIGVVGETGNAKGYDMTATGTWSGYCGDSDLSLGFTPSGLTVTKSATTWITLDIPRRITTVGHRSPKVSDILNPISQGIQGAREVRVTMGITLASGAKFSACANWQPATSLSTACTPRTT